MRFSFATALLVLAVSVAPIEAKAGTVLSGLNCPQTMSCDANDPTFPTVDQIAALGNSCLASNGGGSIPGGFFDISAGLDSNGCLTTRPEATPANAKVAMAPQCCIKKTPKGLCVLHCDIIAQ